MWNMHSKESLKAYYKANLIAFDKLKSILQDKDQKFSFTKLQEAFIKIANPPEKIKSHLENLVTEINKNDSSYYIAVHKEVASRLKKMYHEIKRLRKGFLCTLCDWHNHEHINPQSLTVTYHGKMCLGFTVHLESLIQKYGDIFRLLISLDEFLHITTSKRLMNKYDRQIFHRYELILKKCEKDPKNLENCADFCREFNLNKFSYMFDGEEKAIERILKVYNKEYNKLSDLSHKNLKMQFKFRADQWTHKNTENFI